MRKTFHESIFISSARATLRALVIATAVLLSLTACASRTVSIGEWGRPADLGLTEESLKDVRVAVRCAALDSRGQIVRRQAGICPALERKLQSRGAVITQEDEPARFTLWYIDGGVQASETSFLSKLGFYLSGGLVPLVSNYRVRAELRVSDARGVTLDRAPVELEVIKVFGWAALFANFTTKDKDPLIGKNFFRFAENRVASQVAVAK